MPSASTPATPLGGDVSLHGDLQHDDFHPEDTAPHRSLTVMLATPMLDIGAAAAGVMDTVRILKDAGHHAVVVARGGRRTGELATLGADFAPLDMRSRNPAVMLANVPRLLRVMRRHGCDIVHAHGRAAAWSGYAAARIGGRPFVTTLHKGFREQNRFKRLYNGVMMRGERVIATSGQIADLMRDRYGGAPDAITVIPAAVDLLAFDSAAVSPTRIEAVRQSWGVGPRTRVLLVVGRMLRRKGHHVVVDAVAHLKGLGLKDFACVFAGEEAGNRYSEELWDRVLATGTVDCVRSPARIGDLAAAYAAATVVVSAAVQPEGIQRAILEAQAMARPVIVSDLGAGADVVLAPPLAGEQRTTGLRFPAGDHMALAAAVVRLLAMPDTARNAMGARGRAFVAANFEPAAVAARTLRLYADIARPDPGGPDSARPQAGGHSAG